MSDPLFVAGRADQDRPLVDVLADRLGCSRRKAKTLLDLRQVYVNRRRIWMARHPIREGDRIEVHAADTRPASASSPVLWSTDGLQVLNKPPGQTVTGPNSLEERLRQPGAPQTWKALHRLDRDTSGCVLFCDRSGWRTALIEQFRRREVTKIYRALVAGLPDRARGTIRTQLDGKTAVTHYQVEQRGTLVSCVRVRIETGRTHQIRRHLASIGVPVAGDRTYGSSRIRETALRRVPRPMLHAETLGFRHPSDGNPVRVRAPLPEDFRDQARRLGIRASIRDRRSPPPPPRGNTT